MPDSGLLASAKKKAGQLWSAISPSQVYPTRDEASQKQGEGEYWNYLGQTAPKEFMQAKAGGNVPMYAKSRAIFAVHQAIDAATARSPEHAAVGGGLDPDRAEMFKKVAGVIGGAAIPDSPLTAIAPHGAPAGWLGEELESGLQATAERMFPSVEEATKGTQIGEAIAARKAAPPVQTEGGHGGGGVASVEELNRQREYIRVGRGKTTYQGVQPDPGASGLHPSEGIYSTPKGQVQWRQEAGMQRPDHQGLLDSWAKAMGRTPAKVAGAVAAGALVGAGTASAATPGPEDIDKWVNKHAEANNIDPKLLHEVVSTESAYNPNARSSKGARGLTQLMPATAKAMGVNPKDPEQNVSGGAKYLAQLRERFGDLRKTLAAYNWGPTNVAKHGDAWYEHAPQETRNYVDKIMQRYGGAVKQAQVNPSGEGGAWSEVDPQRQ